MFEWQPSGSWMDHADVRNVTGRACVGSTAVQADVRGADGACDVPGDPRPVDVGLAWRM